MAGNRFLATSLLLVSPSLFAAGPVFNVNSTADTVDASLNGVCETAPGNGICTLRAATMEASSGPNPGLEETRINVPAGTYLLLLPLDSPDDGRNGDLNLARKVKIVGAGTATLGIEPPATIVDANGLDRVFYVHDGAEVVLEGLQVQGGRPPDAERLGEGHGGAVFTRGSLTVRRCLFRDNVAMNPFRGGGIYAEIGSLTVEESTFRVQNGDGGGGLAAAGAAILVSRTTFNSNTSRKGGGIFIGPGGSLKVWNSTISDNTATENGGGLHLASAAAELYNVDHGERGERDLRRRGRRRVLQQRPPAVEHRLRELQRRLRSRRPRVRRRLDDHVERVQRDQRSGIRPCVTGAVQQASPTLGELVWNGGRTYTRLAQATSVGGGHPAGCSTRSAHRSRSTSVGSSARSARRATSERWWRSRRATRTATAS